MMFEGVETMKFNILFFGETLTDLQYRGDGQSIRGAWIVNTGGMLQTGGKYTEIRELTNTKNLTLYRVRQIWQRSVPQILHIPFVFQEFHVSPGILISQTEHTR